MKIVHALKDVEVNGKTEPRWFSKPFISGGDFTRKDGESLADYGKRVESCIVDINTSIGEWERSDIYYSDVNGKYIRPSALADVPKSIPPASIHTQILKGFNAALQNGMDLAARALMAREFRPMTKAATEAENGRRRERNNAKVAAALAGDAAKATEFMAAVAVGKMQEFLAANASGVEGLEPYLALP